jgi:hypothetical protein
MFQVDQQELVSLKSPIVASTPDTTSLRSQIVISKVRRGGRRWAAYAFTEEGVAMLSSVLRSPRAVQVNIEIMRAFVRLRRLAESHADLAKKIHDLENRYEGRFKIVFEAIDQLLMPPTVKRRRIGFRARGKS